MKIDLTSGMFGKAVESLGTAETAADAMKIVENWKSLDESNDCYRIEPYNRMIFDNERSIVIIDFGDYSTFIQISDIAGDMMEQFR